MQGDSSNQTLVPITPCNSCIGRNKRKHFFPYVGGDYSNHSLVPLKSCISTNNGEFNYDDNKKISVPHPCLGRNVHSNEVGEVREQPGYCGGQTTVIPWLSELPDHLVSLILCFLPIEEAARTCILSKRWRHLWSSMLNISLPMRASADTITNILKLFSSSCVSIHLNLIRLLGRFPIGQEFDSWFSLACSRRIEELELKLDLCNGSRDGGPSKPRIRHWFTLPVSPGLSTLKRLTLGYCILGPPACKSLTSLKYLILDRVQLEENMVEELTSSCPMLEELELRECNSNAPFRICITNPKTSKLTIDDNTFGEPLMPLLELRAPYLSTLVLVNEVGRHYRLNLPSLSTLKFVNFYRGFLKNPIPSLTNICSGLDTREMYLCSMVLFNLSRECFNRKVEPDLKPFMTTKVKQLHIRIKNLIHDLPGLVYLLPSLVGVETIVLNFEELYPIRKLVDTRKYLRYLSCSKVSLKDFSHKFSMSYKEAIEEEEEEEELPKDLYWKKTVLLANKNTWSSLRILLSCKMPDLRCLVINGFRRVLLNDIKNEYYNKCDLGGEGCDFLINKDELKILKMLLSHSMTLEYITIKTKDVYLKDTSAIDMKKCEKIYLDGELDKMDIPLWEKVVLSLPRGSSRAKVNVTNI